MNGYVYIALLPVIALFFMQTTGLPVEHHTIPIDSLYEVDLPTNLQPGYDMHAYASLQYYDTLQNFYLLGIEDAKQNLGDIKRKRLKLRGYYAFVEGTVLEKADSFQMESDQEIKLQSEISVKAGDYYVTSRVEEEEIELFYRIAVYESDDFFFQLVFWMPYPDYCQQMPWVESVTQSFRFIGPRNQVGVR
ncbi:MAG: hypothetical protein R3C61_22100 [Bacteroidia bacterium]